MIQPISQSLVLVCTTSQVTWPNVDDPCVDPYEDRSCVGLRVGPRAGVGLVHFFEYFLQRGILGSKHLRLLTLQLGMIGVLRRPGKLLD